MMNEEGKFGILSYGLYRMFKQRFNNRIDKKCEANVNYVDWLRICKKFNLAIMEKIIEGFVFTMPYRLGEVGIVEHVKKIEFDENGDVDTSKLSIDWHATIKLWNRLYPENKNNVKNHKKIKNKPLVYFTNEHTDYRVFRFHWKKRNSNIKNKSAYAMVIPPQHKLALARHIKSNPNVQYCTKF